MEIYGVVTVFEGVFESLYIFTDRQQAEEVYASFISGEGAVDDYTHVYLLEGVPDIGTTQSVVLKNSPPVPKGEARKDG